MPANPTAAVTTRTHKNAVPVSLSPTRTATYAWAKSRMATEKRKIVGIRLPAFDAVAHSQEKHP